MRGARWKTVKGGRLLAASPHSHGIALEALADVQRAMRLYSNRYFLALEAEGPAILRRLPGMDAP